MWIRCQGVVRLALPLSQLQHDCHPRLMMALTVLPSHGTLAGLQVTEGGLSVVSAGLQIALWAETETMYAPATVAVNDIHLSPLSQCEILSGMVFNTQ